MKLSPAPGATPLDADELAALIPSSIGTQGELDAFEEANIADAEPWALARRRGRECLTDAYLRELHRRMFNQVWTWAGRYRTSDKNIGEPWQRIPVCVRQLCDDTRYWIEQRTYSWDPLAARFHHRLVAIHCFANGNGRHARLMTDALLNANGQAIFSWGRANLALAGETRQQYIEALRAADARDYAPLIAFVRS